MWVTNDAALLFHFALDKLNESNCEILWDMVDLGLVRDVEALGKLYLNIEDKVHPKNLSKLITEITGVNIDTIIHKYNQKLKKLDIEELNDEIELILSQISLVYCVSIRFAWNRLEDLSTQLMAIYSEEMYSDAKEKFGILSDKIQVKAKIALKRLENRGISINTERLSVLLENLLNDTITSAKELTNCLPYSRNLFKIELNGCFKSDDDCIPIINKDRLIEILSQIKTELEQMDENIKIEFNIQNFKSAIKYPPFRLWENNRHKHNFIDKWINFEKKKIQYSSAKDLVQYGSEIHPKWKYLLKNGRVSCAEPNIQITPKDSTFRSIYVPRKGYKFLIMDYKYIELCTFAAVSEFKFDYSMLAKVIRGNTDPHCYTASTFCKMTLPEFMNLRESDPEKYNSQRNLAKFMNFSILSGIGISRLREEIQISSHTV